MPVQSKASDVKRLYEAGLSVREIARTLDLSTQGVRYHLHRLDLAPNPPIRNHECDDWRDGECSRCPGDRGMTS